MERFLVTGAMGFVGSHWCEYLLKKGKTVYGIDLAVRYPRLRDYDNFIHVHDTIKDYGLLQKLVNQVDCVCHLAGIANPEQYVRSPRKVIDLTAVVGIRIIDMCRLSGKLFFLTSTSEIYGKSTKIPFSEDDDRVLGSTMTKRWCYSTSKALLEHYLDACRYAKELDYITVRLFNVYGPRLKGRVVSNLIGSALRGEDIVLHGEGEQTRSFTYIDDVLEAFEALIADPACYNQVFNVGNPTETNLNDLAAVVKKVTGSSSTIRYVTHDEHYGEGFEDIPRRVPDVSRIRRLAGWSANTTLEEGIRRICAYERAQGGAERRKRGQ